MELAITARQAYLMFHLVTGVVILHGLFEGVLWFFNPARSRRTAVAIAGVALAAWVTAFSGTWMVYPGYRAKAPAGANIVDYPSNTCSITTG